MGRCENGKMGRCENGKMGKWEDVKMGNVKIENVKMEKWEDQESRFLPPLPWERVGVRRHIPKTQVFFPPRTEVFKY
jgi:hypothetical protein